MLPPGSTIAGYRVRRVLGSGRMGTVYLVGSPDLPRDQALKVLGGDLGHDPEFRARFLREAEVAAGLNHPNIVAVHRRGSTPDGQLWIAMQFVDGTNADVAQRSGRMTPERAVHIIGEIAEALDYAHRHHVVHRDVKPANILLSGPAGPSEHALLADFGIARALGHAELTTAGQVLTTVAYAAPEVLAGQPVDGQADLYSLGCTLFRLLTGRVPFPGDGGMAATVGAHLHQAPPRVTDLVPTLPPALDDVIAKALAKDPAQRYPTGAALAGAAAEAVLAGAAVPPPAPPASPAVRRRLAWVAGALAALVAVTLGVVALRSGGSETAAPPTDSTVASPPIVADSGLDPLLLSEPNISAIMGTPMQLGASAGELIDYAGLIREDRCGPAYGPLAQSVYGGSGYLGIRARGYRTVEARPAQGPASAQQAVVAYPSPAAADDIVDRQLAAWRECAGRTVTRRVPAEDPNARVAFGTVDTTDTDVNVVTQRVGAGGFVCARGLTARNNVVVDVLVCRMNDATRQALDIAHDIVARIG